MPETAIDMQKKCIEFEKKYSRKKSTDILKTKSISNCKHQNIQLYLRKIQQQVRKHNLNVEK